MIVSFEGRVSDKEKRFSEEAACFVLEKYCSDHSKVHVNISHVPNMLRDDCRRGNTDHGLSNVEFVDARTPKTYFIEIAKDQRLRDRATTLFHELVHVKQFVLGEIKFFKIGSVYHIISGSGKHSTVNTLYYELPWEKEAFENQRLLLDEFVSKNTKWRSYVKSD